MKPTRLFAAALALLLASPLCAQDPVQPQSPSATTTAPQGRTHGRGGQGRQIPSNFRVAGVWQQVQAYTDSTGAVQDMYLPVWKVLQGDGHFTNFVMTYYKAPAFITQEGDFRVVSDKYYSERTRQSVVAPELVGVEVMMEYTLNEEAGEMSLRFMLPNSEQPQTERWRRVRLEVPQQLRGGN
ncbi:MAG: DUF4488 domain-containing protein [Bacteroidaceae bacterium]|nr:DUF4488 domain-containing protein [Bacteroidaceae bacterium]